MQENDNRDQPNAEQSSAVLPNVAKSSIDEIDSSTSFLVSPNDFPTGYRRIIADVEGVRECGIFAFFRLHLTLFHQTI